VFGCIPAALATLAVGSAASGAGTSGRGPITIAAVGDIAMAPSALSSDSFFDSAVRRRLRADITLGNLEGTLATGGSSKCGPQSTDCFAFRAPPAYAKTLRHAGFSILNLANNHALDYGTEGQTETLAALRSAGLRYTGRPGEVAVLRRGGVKIAVVGFAPYPWAQSLLDIEGATRIVRKAGEKADIVVVTMHAGAEGSDHQHVRPGPEVFLGEQRGNVEAFAHAVVRAGADAVIGHGPHVLRGLEWYRGHVIAYSMGNFLGNGTLAVSGVSGVSAVIHISLRRDGSFRSGSLVPLRLTAGGLPRVDPAKESLGIVRSLSRDDFGKHAVRVTKTGALLPPAWRTG
jgi:Bacterial capsule synthesis protein PGA_cap